MEKKDVVRLTDAERETLWSIVRKLSGSSQKVRRAQVLLKADADGPNWTDKKIAEAFSCRTKTVENIRQRLVTRGFDIFMFTEPHLVCDNLNTHTMGAFHEAFPARQARELVRRLDFRFTPKHGSRLNISENELSSLTRQCLKGRRIGDIAELRRETTAWATASNDKQRGVDWQFTINDARLKLKSLYPKVKL
jgi:hypothetical protein